MTVKKHIGKMTIYLPGYNMLTSIPDTTGEIPFLAIYSEICLACLVKNSAHKFDRSNGTIWARAASTSHRWVVPISEGDVLCKTLKQEASIPFCKEWLFRWNVLSIQFLIAFSICAVFRWEAFYQHTAEILARCSSWNHQLVSAPWDTQCSTIGDFLGGVKYQVMIVEGDNLCDLF